MAVGSQGEQTRRKQRKPRAAIVLHRSSSGWPSHDVSHVRHPAPPHIWRMRTNTLLAMLLCYTPLWSVEKTSGLSSKKTKQTKPNTLPLDCNMLRHLQKCTAVSRIHIYLWRQYRLTKNWPWQARISLCGYKMDAGIHGEIPRRKRSKPLVYRQKN